MRRATMQPSAVRERGALVIGLGAAGLLALAALAPFSDPELAAQAALARSAGQAAAAVAEEWQRMLAAEADPCVPASPVFAGAAARVERAPVRDLTLERAPGPTAFDALLAESERLELAEGDRPGALAAALEALSKHPDLPRAAEGRLRAIQLARLAGQDEVAREQWRLLAAEVAPGDARGTTSYLLVASLAVASAWTAEERAAATDALVTAWTGGQLALPVAEVRVARVPDESRWELADTERLAALEARLAALAPEGAQALAATRAEIALAALERFVTVPDTQADNAWHVASCDGGFLVQRTTSTGQRRAFLTTPDALQSALAERVQRERLLPAGFALDFRGDRAELGPLVRGATELAGGAGEFVLRHADPEAAMRGGSARLALVRAGLWLAAALCAAASVATWRALRRERRLSELRTAFVASVSHELRTPVSSILLLAENLQAGRVGETGAAGYYKLLRREALRLRGLVDDVLDVSRLERGKPLAVHAETLELAPWLAELAADARAWADEHGLELEIVLGQVAGSVRADGEALRRAVFNLLDNARKHSGSRQVELGAALADGAPPTLVISVRDRGRGIPPEQRARAFLPFERLNGDAAGAGLGLAIVREIARAHAGDARVIDAGPGARFELEIPLEQAPETP